MPWEDAISAIEARAGDLWPGLQAAVPLALESTNFQRPDGPLGPWVMVRAEWNGGEFLTVGSPGSNEVRREGLIWVYAYIPQGDGVGRAHQLASQAASMFEGQDFAGVVCWAAMPGGPASSEDGNYFGQSASIPFTFDETA